ncbi:hypothetical protein TrLO_g7167 [Triparma laevis f. longispina]|uniref:Uncharacterized protein n=1 Tax=Triparma laevis f. longispina TaxID=1714387 RepID=A0A9W7FLZ8_9STRA|nr:hypothetical protein TrLO_g7167 [Triparma laevis f. longispina]
MFLPPALSAQFLSLLVSSSGIFTESLASDCSTNIPTFQTFLVYLLLSLFTLLLHRRQYLNDPNVIDKPYKIYNVKHALKLSAPWYTYLLIGFLDVESNFLVVTAFKMTSLTSISLIDCTSIPFVMFFSRIILGRSYSVPQYWSAIVSVVGIGLIIMSDVMVVLEREEVWQLFTDPDPKCDAWRSGLLISGYVASIAGFYILVSGFLTKSSAALLNVSLLTADIYSLLFVVFAEHVVPGPLYFAGTVVVFAGVGLFNYYEQRVIESEGGSSEEARALLTSSSNTTSDITQCYTFDPSVASSLGYSECGCRCTSADTASTGTFFSDPTILSANCAIWSPLANAFSIANMLNAVVSALFAGKIIVHCLFNDAQIWDRSPKGHFTQFILHNRAFFFSLHALV